MRVTGSPDGCDEAARRLQRGAAEVTRTAEALQRAEVAGWTGAAAQGWERLASERVRRLREAASGLAAVSGALAQHADELRELQQRARRLAREAADAGLAMDEDGRIAPVPPPTSGAPELLRAELHRREVRRRLVAEAEVVRSEEDRAHERLRVEVARSLDAPAPGGDCDWGLVARLQQWWQREADAAADPAPGGWDLPAAAVSVVQATASSTDRLPAVLRSASVSNGFGAGVGVVVDVGVNDHDLDDALTKNAVVTGAAVGAGLVAAGSVPVWVGVAGAGAAGFGAGRLFDAFGHHLWWVQTSAERRAARGRRAIPAATAGRHPYLPPLPGDHARPRHVVHRTPAPEPGPAARRP